MSEPVKNAWHRLDNAAKIFPPTSGKTDTKVFRVSCELYGAVDGKLLQSALDSAIEDFPGFRCILKRGMFWYYLEQSNIRPLVRVEDAPPCSTVYLDRKSLLFDVTYYGGRINLEVYHALTDGTGALQFLKVLVLYYLKLAHPEIPRGVSIGDYDASDARKMSDSFDKYYDRDKSRIKINQPSRQNRGESDIPESLNESEASVSVTRETSGRGTPVIRRSKIPSAFQLKGPKEAEWRLNIIEGSISVKSVLEKAREYDSTITIFITALLMRSIFEEISVRDRKKPVVITVPVNLRNYFQSKSTRNFFSLVDVKYDFENNSDTLEDIIKHVKESFNLHLNEEYLQSRLNKLLSFERNLFVRPVPLTIKNFFLSLAYYFSAREVTASVSNVGRVILPDELKPYIKLFDVFTSTEKLQLCICSYGDIMNLSFSAPFVSTDIQRNFFRRLAGMGTEVRIVSNTNSR